MKSLAKGVNSEAIFKLIKVVLQTQQDIYKEAMCKDTSQIEDIADKLETDKALYGENEKMEVNDEVDEYEDEEDGTSSP